MRKMASWIQLSRGLVSALLLIMNGMCIFLALCSFGFGIVDLRILKQYGEEQATGTAAGDVIVMVASLMLIAVAVIGCVGVIKKNLKCLYMYVGLIMILVVLEMMIAIFVALQRYGLQFRITEWIREDFFRNVTGEDRSMHERSWDELQIDFQCCGLNGPADYLAIQQPISLSCCPRAYRARTAFAQQQLYRICIEIEQYISAGGEPSITVRKLQYYRFELYVGEGKAPSFRVRNLMMQSIIYTNIIKRNAGYYTEGCEDEILDMLRSDADWLLGAAIISFWLEGAGMLLASWLANNIKNSVTVYKDTVRY